MVQTEKIIIEKSATLIQNKLRKEIKAEKKQRTENGGKGRLINQMDKGRIVGMKESGMSLAFCIADKRKEVVLYDWLNIERLPIEKQC